MRVLAWRFSSMQLAPKSPAARWINYPLCPVLSWSCGAAVRWGVGSGAAALPSCPARSLQAGASSLWPCFLLAASCLTLLVPFWENIRCLLSRLIKFASVFTLTTAMWALPRELMYRAYTADLARCCADASSLPPSSWMWATVQPGLRDHRSRGSTGKKKAGTCPWCWL